MSETENKEVSNVEFLDLGQDEDNLEELKAGDAITLEEATGVLEYNYRAPKITMGEEFYDQPEKEKAKYMHKLASAMNHAAKILQDERNALLDEIVKLKESNSNAEIQVMIQKNIAANALEQLNTAKQEDAIRTGHLQGRIKTLETVVKAAGLKID